MNKIINQKRYDTETARFLGSWDSGHYANDLQYCAESLYVKKTGEYFLHGQGGAMTIYSRECEGGICGGEGIRPLTFEAAKEWAEERLSGDDYTAIFGEVEEEEAGDKEKITLTLPCETINALKERKEVTGANVSWLVSKALKEAGY